jgi:hypothetical protein
VSYSATEERHRAHQVRREPGGEQPPLAQRLVHQPELQLLQVAQAAVDQLRRPAGRAGGDVARLDQRHGQPARRGVERGTGPGDAATDDDHVEPLRAQAVEVGHAPDRRQLAGRVTGDGGITTHAF